MPSNYNVSDETKLSIHSFIVDDINGKAFDFSSLKGKKILVVNTASKCGLTPQYEELERLYNEYKNQNFVILKWKDTLNSKSHLKFKIFKIFDIRRLTNLLLKNKPSMLTILILVKRKFYIFDSKFFISF